MKTSPSLSLSLEYLPIAALKPDPKNARLHSPKQIAALSRAIESFGFTNPLLIDQNDVVVAGHGRLQAAKGLGFAELPVIRLEHLTPAQIRAYRIADNRLAELAEWDEAALRIEIQALSELELDFDLTVIGFEAPQIDIMLQSADEAVPEPELPPVDLTAPVVSKPGDLWLLGRHRLLCGDALDPRSYDTVMAGVPAQLVFTDPPYNVPVAGHILTQNSHQHTEFAMASGEMSDLEFTAFLGKVITLMRQYAQNGSIHDICMDWRHIHHLLEAGKAYSELKNICIWNKQNGGMGSLYRSKHEMIAVFKNGSASHINNIELGRHGRYRTNVWDYAGQTSPHAKRDTELAMHPTVKPTQLVEDALYDCSNRHDIVLDPFGGSGTTLIAAERAGRQARLLEISPRYVDVTLRRWQELTGQPAIHQQTGETFADLSHERLGDMACVRH